MSTASEHAGQAALSICEALLLAMNDRGLLPEHEIVGVLRDAAAMRGRRLAASDRNSHWIPVADEIVDRPATPGHTR